MYKIDEVTKQVGLTKRTLRYYEEIGLIHPPERSEGNIRLYTDRDIERIKKIVEAKEVLGITLQEMQHFLSLKERMEKRRNSDNPLDRAMIQEIKDMLESQVQTLDIKMKQMERVKAELEDSLERARNFLEKTKGE
ncbi:MerR family transcriptional regulator [Bacillus cytotoxicus]|uniref:Transcriptional regulator, MerR family n=2 Tax=Bacillus cytotoxicus TaxID=580165 RepID=A0AAX2CN73_9BACI|nr:MULTISPECIES: MerR family transcriptional regulator [Bacillus cereus group]ABS24072.1 putative transcriptional regulator, MerR family [Bacillus cytotoxicus NVH 391-98]AWC30647.1 MerR family transcriptional regulator [Bacillus cytotoxicus]AWC34703.1 MerR family transcriptional regulator [Bacillus cytotoxicus]AWC38695.1 MerR family transcriptional regulator [Bacillus cytotoxicus]AWC42788.1 MerR family transcriptional regulator [Bacillus cytotoxicus]